VSQVFRPAEVQYQAGSFDGERIRQFYTMTGVAFRSLFAYSPRENIEQILSAAWDATDPRTEAQYNDFYRDSMLVTEECVQWHQEKNGQRLRRVIHAATLAKELGVNSFCEVGAGIGTDGVALASLGFECKYLAEINHHSRRMITRMANFALHDPVTIVDLSATTKELAHRHFGPVDWLYSSDVFEHIYDLEDWLDPWIKSFKVVIVYAPFASNEVQHQHTDYKRSQFNNFMSKRGFTKLTVHGLGIPPMVYRRPR